LKGARGFAPVLKRLDARWPFQLHIDWSMLEIGAVLIQKDDDGKECIIAYALQSNNDIEAKYSSYDGECLATVWIVAHFVHIFIDRVSYL